MRRYVMIALVFVTTIVSTFALVRCGSGVGGTGSVSIENVD